MSLESVVAVLDEHGPSTRHEIAERLSVTPETVHAQLKRLVTHGRVSRYEHPVRRRGQPVFIYELPQQRPRPVGDRWLAARRAGTVPPLDRDRAACADMAPEMFFDRGPELAVQICADCPVDVGCLDFAIRTGTEHGVFGGCTPDERHRLAVSGMGRRVVVEHRGYGCETGCAGHVVLVDGEEVGDFEFGGPGYLRGGQLVSESHREYAERIVREQAGDDHIADLDWESCVIVDD